MQFLNKIHTIGMLLAIILVVGSCQNPTGGDVADSTAEVIDTGPKQRSPVISAAEEVTIVYDGLTQNRARIGIIIGLIFLGFFIFAIAADGPREPLKTRLTIVAFGSILCGLYLIHLWYS